MAGACRQTRGEPIDALGYTQHETSVLAILRHYCATFAAPERQSWIAAISVALADFGSARGPDVAVAALGVMQAIRRTRRSSFLFNCADCSVCSQSVTGHERLLMSAIRAVTRDRRDAALAHATLLCEGNDAEAVILATEVLFDRIYPGHLASRTGPYGRELEPVPSAGS